MAPPTASASRSAATAPRTRSRFLEAGVPAVEFGPAGAGHHGPEEWVSIRSLGEYRQALVEFVQPARRTGWARTSAQLRDCLMLEDIPRPGLWKRFLLGALPDRLRGRRRDRRGGLPRGRQGRRRRSTRARSSSSARATLATTDAGKPQTMMLLGSDKRPKNNVDGRRRAAPRSDTMMLVRLDPRKKATALLSLPRDLKVEIPGHGTDKLNAAYSLGGARLTRRDGQAARPA